MKQALYYVSGRISAALRIFFPVAIKAESLRPVYAAVMAACLLLGACSKSRIRGEGATISDTRTLPSFSAIDANGSSRVNIVRDSVYKVIVTGYQNLVPVYETQVSAGRLSLQFQDRYHNIRNDNIVVEVHMPAVTEVLLNGSGDIAVAPGFTGTFLGRINGSGNMRLSGGAFSTATYYINGSGNINALDATADTAYATISGSGNIDLAVRDYLYAKISGSGDITYSGNPVTQVDVSGSGKVRKQ